MSIKSLKEIQKEELFASGHRMCAGCGPAICVRQTLLAAGRPVIMVSATGCVEVSTTIYPYTSWKIPWMHIAFENAAAVASGIEAALKKLSRNGKAKKYDVIAFAGDGGTFDIGLQALSGAIERGHDFLYICYDNEAYMNTGIQRSGATPHGADTTTSPAGSVIPGKKEYKKRLTDIIIAHDPAYAATASIAYWKDYMNKVIKGLDANGPAFLHVFAPCPRGWRFPSNQTISIARLAVETRYFPLYEYENGKYTLSLDIPKPKPIEEFIKPQRRFRHLLEPKNKQVLEELKNDIERNWERIKKLCSL